MKKAQDIQQLLKRSGIKDHWGVSDAVVGLMAQCSGFNPRIPSQAASNHALKTIFPG